MKKAKKLFIPLLVISVLTISIHFFFIAPSIDPKISLPIEDHWFRIDITEGKIIRDLYFFYDFEKEEGYFKFRTGGNTKMNKLNIDFPEQLEIFNVSIITSDTREALSLQEKDYWVDSNYIHLNDNEQNLKKWSNTNLEFLISVNNSNSSFYPNGRFLFAVDGGVSEVTLNDKKEDEFYGALLKFKFGNKYRCSDNCFVLWKFYTEEGFQALSNQDSLLVVAGNNSKKMGRLVDFAIWTYNFEEKEKASYNLAWGIAFFSGIISGAIFWFFNLIFSRKKIVFNRNKIQNINYNFYNRSKTNLSIFKFLMKIDQRIKSYNFDTTILTGMIAFITLYLGFIFSGSLNKLNLNSAVLVGLLYLGIPVMIIVMVIWPYMQLVLFPTRKQFLQKADLLTTVAGSIAFWVLVWILLVVIWVLEFFSSKFGLQFLSTNNWPNFITSGLLWLFFGLAVLSAIYWFKPALIKKFKQEYPLLMEKDLPTPSHKKPVNRKTIRKKPTTKKKTTKKK